MTTTTRDDDSYIHLHLHQPASNFNRNNSGWEFYTFNDVINVVVIMGFLYVTHTLHGIHEPMLPMTNHHYRSLPVQEPIVWETSEDIYFSRDEDPLERGLGLGREADYSWNTCKRAKVRIKLNYANWESAISSLQIKIKLTIHYDVKEYDGSAKCFKNLIVHFKCQ